MQILVDQGTPVPLRQFLPDHQIFTAYERGWSSMKNGELLQLAESNAFEMLITTDTNLKYQQNLAGRRISLVVLCTTSWSRTRANVDFVLDAVSVALPGSYREVLFP